VLIKADKVDKVTKGGIQLVQETIERRETATNTGTLVAIDEKYAWDMYDEPLAKVGDRVLFVVYAGVIIPSFDPENPEDVYRIMNDEDVLMREPQTIKNEA